MGLHVNNKNKIIKCLILTLSCIAILMSVFFAGLALAENKTEPAKEPEKPAQKAENGSIKVTEEMAVKTPNTLD